jgi:ABC-type dipeptide/oligopeptide/nickel transport system permease subunit
MKVTVPFAALLLAVAIGYILGTESGRAKRDDLLVRLGRGTGGDAELGVDDAAS